MVVESCSAQRRAEVVEMVCKYHELVTGKKIQLLFSENKELTEHVMTKQAFAEQNKTQQPKKSLSDDDDHKKGPRSLSPAARAQPGTVSTQHLTDQAVSFVVLCCVVLCCVVLCCVVLM